MFLLPHQYMECSMEFASEVTKANMDFASAVAEANVKVCRTVVEGQSLLMLRLWMGDEDACDFLLEHGTNDLADAVRHKHQMKSLIKAKSNRTKSEYRPGLSEHFLSGLQVVPRPRLHM